LPIALLCAFLSTIGCSGNSTKALVMQLQDPDVQRRRAAARDLGAAAVDAHAAAAALSGALADADLEVRELAAGSLGYLGANVATTSVPALEKALADHEPSVRLTAALALQKIDPASQRYAPVLIDALRAGDGTAFLEIARMGGDARWAVPTLTSLLSDRRTKIRALAAHSLGSIGPAASDAQAALRQRTRDANASVRKAAHNALRQIGSHDEQEGV
jgi:HEAT repeat protein